MTAAASFSSSLPVPVIGPAELARRLGLPEPTPEQARVIQAPMAPMAVVAGAGSGKSETMAARVVWLVANGLVRPERVLGLTFTRKAAAELSARVRKRLDQLREHDDLVTPDVLDGEPTVSTYHAYAARIFADHALREAMEPTMRLISPAVAWQIASRVVDSYDGPMELIDWAPDTVTKAVMELAGELSEHLCDADEVRQVGRWLHERLAAVEKPLKRQRTVLAQQAVREQLLPLVEAYTRAKAQREVIDHGDQMAFAARIAHRHPEAGLVERSRYAVVLLDEYQDTSHAQLVLLRSLFGPVHGRAGHPVTAVGDPCQSIYGWRGASAGNLLRFARDFPLRQDRQQCTVPPPMPVGTREPVDSVVPAPVERLSVSFRNGDRVLEVAARVQRRLRAEAGIVPRLLPGPARRGRGRVECALLDTVEDEAEHIAVRITRLIALQPRIAPDGRPWAEERTQGLRFSDIAVLARKRSQFPLIRRALEARDIPVEVVGLGGLLTVPEVQDVVATLKVMHDPTSGASLVRLLTGPRWRIGPRDLVALGRRARELAREVARDLASPAEAEEEPGDPFPPATAAQSQQSPKDPQSLQSLQSAQTPRPAQSGADPLRKLIDELNEETGSLVDALDDPGSAEHYTAEGFRRLQRLRDELRMLRGHVGLPLPDLVGEVERTLGLDIEVAARSGLDTVTARADLDAFTDAAASFAGDAEDPTLGAFLAFLKAAETEEFGLEAGRVGDGDSVKLLTVHAAKGLEWPVVVVPGLSYIPQKNGGPAKGSIFPAPPRNATRWTGNPRLLPFPLRGDRDDLPRLAGLDKDELTAFEQACAEREMREERRLAYVAVTRASYLLIATGYRWGTASRPLRPSPFLVEIREACRAGAGSVPVWTDRPGDDAVNPLLAEPESAPWPRTPDGERQAAIVAGARMVEDAMAGRARAWAGGTGLSGPDHDRMSAWARDVELLLAERDRGRGGDGMRVSLPDRLTVSSLVSLAGDPNALARQIRRPMPRPPAPFARRGTVFHRWLESRWGQQRLLDDADLSGAADDDAVDDRRFALLRARFEQSPWAGREPVDVEIPFEMVIGDRLIRGRMDAVFRTADGYEVVDWKTGASPSPEQARAASVQLAAYRVAWAELAGVPVEAVSAALHYVFPNVTVRPADLLDLDGLIALVETVPRK